MAALVGQIAGRPIFAHDVLRDLEDQLRALGGQVAEGRMSAAGFRRQAGELILRQVQGLVQNRLTLEEAERSLTRTERANLDRFRAIRRRELVRQFGQGSEALADRTLRAQAGRSLEEMLQDDRDRLVVLTYRQRKVEPLINVTRRDVERYYRDRAAEFNPPDRRDVRVLYVTDPALAERLGGLRDRGADFDRLAETAAAGAVPMSDVEGDNPFGFADPGPYVTAGPGAVVGPLPAPGRGRYYFVAVDAVRRGVGQTEREAQIEIERLLRDRQRETLALRDFDRLRREASVTEERRMADAVTRIAEARYLPPTRRGG